MLGRRNVGVITARSGFVSSFAGAQVLLIWCNDELEIVWCCEVILEGKGSKETFVLFQLTLLT